MVFSLVHSKITGAHTCVDVARSYTVPSEDFRMRVERRNAPERRFPTLHFDKAVELLDRPITRVVRACVGDSS